MFGQTYFGEGYFGGQPVTAAAPSGTPGTMRPTTFDVPTMRPTPQA